MDHQSLSKQNLHVPAADRIDSQKSMTVDVTHDQSDLVAVCIQQNVGLPPGFTVARTFPCTSVDTSAANTDANARTTF